MADLFWNFIARLLARPAVIDWLAARANANRDSDITKDGEVYMARGWVFNPYNRTTRRRQYWWLPVSLRLHDIRLPDSDRHLHDHPWQARSLILRGGYAEQLADRPEPIVRWEGTSVKISHNRFHKITEVAAGGALTLVVLGRYRGDWGFWVGYRKVPHAEYLA